MADLAVNGEEIRMELNQMNLDQIISNSSEMKLLEKRMVFLSEAVNSGVARRLVNHLLALDAESDKPIYMFINSPGGEVNSGFSIYDTMRFLNSEVRVITTGLCASIATIINLGAPKQHRYSMPNSHFLIHQPLIGGHIQGQASDLEITAKEILKTRKKLNELLAKECGQSFERIEEDTTRDYWMTASEAAEYGLISKVISKMTDIKN